MSEGGVKDKDNLIDNPVTMMDVEHMVPASNPAMETGEQDKVDLGQHDALVENREEVQMDREEQMEKVASPLHENA